MSVVPMSQRIETERKEMKLGEIKELNLDGCSATEIEGLSDEYTSLQRLSLANIGLTSLAGLPALPALTKLDVSGNPICGGIDVLAKCSNLEIINLSGNKLKSVSDLMPLSSLEHLMALELNNCDIAAIENYRKEVFAVLPNLKFLDGLDQAGEEEPIHKEECIIDAAENGEEDDEEDEEDVDEEVGISALQGSKDLDDDEEDYVPGEEEDEIEDDVDDEDDDEDEDDEDNNDDVDEDEVANLSAAGVTGPRRAVKRVADDSSEVDVTSAKCPAPEANGDVEAETTNGTEEVSEHA